MQDARGRGCCGTASLQRSPGPAGKQMAQHLVHARGLGRCVALALLLRSALQHLQRRQGCSTPYARKAPGKQGAAVLVDSGAVQAVEETDRTVSLLSSAVEDLQRSSEAFQVLACFASTQFSICCRQCCSGIVQSLLASRQQSRASKAACSSKPWLCFHATGLQLQMLPPTLPFDSRGTSAVSEMP